MSKNKVIAVLWELFTIQPHIRLPYMIMLKTFNFKISYMKINRWQADNFKMERKIKKHCY